MNNLVIKSVKQALSEYKMLTRGERVVCAVSGGADSVAMLRALFLLKDELGIDVCACHLNHFLRGDESDRDADFVRRLCADMNIALYDEKIEVGAGAGLEERARRVRYEFYDRAIKNLEAQKLATAHHAEDNLETVLFHIARGSGLRGLCGIPPIRDNIIRPMLFCGKDEILGFLKSEGQSWVEDSTNRADDYTRNLIRHKVLPVLSQINSNAVSNSSNCIRTLAQDELALSQLAEMWLCENEGDDFLPVKLAEQPDALIARVLKIKCKKSFKNKNRDLDFSHTCDIINLIRQSKTVGEVHLFNGCAVKRAGDKIYFVEKEEALCEVILNPGENATVSGYKITCLGAPITIRARRDGDRVRLAGRKTRLLKKIFCDAKIPQHLRDSIPIIERNGEIIAVCGFGFAEGHKDGGVTIELDA